MAVPKVLADVVATAMGRLHRADPVTPNSGGPAGNFRLTAWTGLILLALFIVECVTLLSLGAMITLHIVLGGVLVPLAVLKTATTAWRILRYYTGEPSYRAAGPPPLLLRLLGPLVVLGGLAVLGSGLALIPLGRSAFNPFWSIGGNSVDAVTVHKASFIFWLAVTGVHVLVHLANALNVTRSSAAGNRRIDGARARFAVVSVVMAAGLVAGFAVLHYAGAWTTDRIGSHDRVRPSD